MGEEHDKEEDESRLDLYAVLELTREATVEDVRLAFRQLAAKNHPDRNETDPKALLRFKRVNAAYQVLSDPEKRELYDQLTTPIEDIPAAPPSGEALVRAEDVREWKVAEDDRVRSTRRVRRRVPRKSGKTNWAWGMMIGSLVLVGGAWAVIPDASVVNPVRPVAAVSAPSGAGGGAAAEGTSGSENDLPGVRAELDRMATTPSEEPESLAGNPREHVSLLSVAAPEPESPTRAVTGDKWSFSVPMEWRDASDAHAIVWKGPPLATGDAPRVTLLVSSFTGDSAAYFKSLEKRGRSGVVVDAESWESESQPDGLKREGRVVSGGAVSARFVEYAVAVRGKGYELTCSTPPLAFEGETPTCERILGSLQIK